VGKKEQTPLTSSSGFKALRDERGLEDSRTMMPSGIDLLHVEFN